MIVSVAAHAKANAQWELFQRVQSTMKSMLMSAQSVVHAQAFALQKQSIFHKFIFENNFISKNRYFTKEKYLFFLQKIEKREKKNLKYHKKRVTL